ncbi:Ger(x)C family spore germination protein [Bacillus sp. H-16]|uniref:Ger(x)C family spore germination protein n=1 Tax=Alteribacter salitolerans TaxID=2912333 RepID=UPI0019622B8C|nr:Ger(x)C family spore germination protein [Alteribacter salitolerans]MBM7097164.1 Ger(x)C family spore germination protein [Alteribacter salitolerans]
MKTVRQFSLCILCLILLSGCWDSRQLRDITIAKSAGLDLMEDGLYQSTLSSPVPSKREAPERTEVVSGLGHTVREARMALDNKVSERIDIARLRVIVIGRDLAEESLYNPIDVMYRDPRGSLGAKIAIFNGMAQDIISKDLPDKPRTSEFIADLLETAEENSIVENLNVQLICPIMFDPGQDMVIPLMELNEEDESSLVGNALFNGEKMTGTLSPEDSVLLNLMKNVRGRNTFLTEKVSEENAETEEFITLLVREADRNLKVDVNHAAKSVTAEVNLTMKVKVIEYPKDELHDPANVAMLNERLGRAFTAEAEQIFETLQEANCDALGIGRRVIAFHNQFWRENDWNEVYPDITIKPNVTVEIISHGIIN